MSDLLKILEEIKEKANKNDEFDGYDDYNENQVSQGLVLPILKNLGWDTDNVKEVYPEFEKDDGYMDFVLFAKKYDNPKNEKPNVIIEVKRNSELLDKAKEQLKSYSFSYDDEKIINVLTDGRKWIFYLKISDDLTPAAFVDIAANDCDVAEKNLIDFLSKSKISNDDGSLKNLYRNSERKLLKTEIEKSWCRLFANDVFEKLILKTLNDKVLNDFGFTNEDVESFAKEKISQVKPSEEDILKNYESKFKGNLKICAYEGRNKVKIVSPSNEFEYPSMKAAITDFILDISKINEGRGKSVFEYCYLENKRNSKNKTKENMSCFIEKLDDISFKPKGSTIDISGYCFGILAGKDPMIKKLFRPLYIKFDENGKPEPRGRIVFKEMLKK
jgi:hypothetical protein